MGLHRLSWRTVLAVAIASPWIAQAGPQDALHSKDIYLSGKVTLEKARLGTPVEVRVICDGRPTLAVKSEANGNFQIDLEDGENGSQNGGSRSRTRTGLAGCLVQASLPGFRSDSVKIAALSRTDSPNIGTIILHRPEGFAGNIVSPTSAAASKDARKALDKAHIELQNRDWSRAKQSLQHAVDLDPQYAEAWFELGKLQETTNTLDARASYAKAIAADPAYVFPYQQVIALGTREQGWHEVFDNATELLKLCPHEYPDAWYDLAFASLQLERKEDAEKSARRGIQEDPEHHLPEIERLLGSILSAKGDRTGAVEHFGNYLKWSPNASDAASIEHQISMLSAAQARKQL